MRPAVEVQHDVREQPEVERGDPQLAWPGFVQKSRNAGIDAYLIALLVVGFLPIVGLGTAITFGLSIALGAAAGSREVKSGNLPWLFHSEEART